jgi:cob(I)alamin adenosyltransferase
VDELNSLIGVVLSSKNLDEDVRDVLVRVQHQLFDLGGELCMPGETVMTADNVTWIESVLDTLNENLPPLKDFILPGGTTEAGNCHVARTVCRRAERRVLGLSRDDMVNEQALVYLNRLSDLLFVMARTLNRRAGHPEPLWQKGL